MSKIKLDANASGTGVFTIASPSGNTNRTVTLPDSDGEFVLSASGTISNFASTGIDDNATSTAITIDTSGNLCVGTTSAGVAGVSVATGKNIGFKQANGQSIANMFRQNSSAAFVLSAGYQYSSSPNGFASSYSSSLSRTAMWLGDSVRFYADPASTVAAGTDITPTERMRIDSSGNLILGTTAARTGTFSLTLESGNSYFMMRAAGTSSLSQIAFIRNTAVTPVQVGTITTNGSSTTYSTSSDYRLKENVVSLDNAANRLKQIPVHRFNFIADPDTTVDGFLAHEVADVVPEAIVGTKDEVDDEGNPVYQGIDQSKLVPLLTAALQEALTKIESLETRLSALEAN